jgi:hypothetical protein
LFATNAVEVLPEILIPDTALAPVDERPLIEEFEIKIPVDVFEQLIPVTVPPVPEDVNPVIVLPLITELEAPLNELPKLIPVIVPCPLIVDSVLFEIDELVPPQ